MSANVTWGVPATAAPPEPDPNAPAPAAAPVAPPPAGMNAGSVLVLSILAGGIVMWIAGRYRARQQEEEAAQLQARVDEANFDLEGAREDEQLSLARAFSQRPSTPVGWR